MDHDAPRSRAARLALTAALTAALAAPAFSLSPPREGNQSAATPAGPHAATPPDRPDSHPADHSAVMADDEWYSTPRVVLSSHRIDRFEAIGRLQRALASDPDRSIDWVILGELAQEVALDVPAPQAIHYLAIARDAYARAHRLQPDDPGIRAALDFVRDQDSALDDLIAERRALIPAYLDARRRELRRPGTSPMLRDPSAGSDPPRPPVVDPTARRPAMPAPDAPADPPDEVAPPDGAVRRSDAIDRPEGRPLGPNGDAIEPVVFDGFYLASPQAELTPGSAARVPSPGAARMSLPSPLMPIDPTDRRASGTPRSLQETPPRVPEPLPVLSLPTDSHTGAAVPRPIGTMPTTAPVPPEILITPPTIAPYLRP